MADNDPRLDPSTTSPEYQYMLPYWMKIDALLGGTASMRAAGQAFLPQHPDELNTTYQERLNMAVLFNATELTLKEWVGKPFTEPVTISDEVPEQAKEWLIDVDLQGNNIDVFARQWFHEGMAKGYAHVLVDYPRITAVNPDGSPRTLAQDVSEGVRPYMVLVKPEALIFAERTIINGKELITHCRIRQRVYQREGFAMIARERIKVYDASINGLMGTVRTFEFRKNEKNKDEWMLIDVQPYDWPFIPIVTFYAERSDFMMCKPPLDSLADLNVTHWQSTSDQRVIITVCRFPILALSGGIDDQNKLTIGPSSWLYCPDPQGKFYYVEHSGAAVESGRKDLEDLENQMAAYGAMYMKKRAGGATATERNMDSSEATSPLQDAALRFNDALTTALQYMGRWIKLEIKGTLKVVTDFDEEALADQVNLSALVAARTGRDLSRVNFLSELQRRQVLSSDFDFDQNAQQLEEEASALLAASQLMIDEAGGGNGEQDQNNQQQDNGQEKAPPGNAGGS